MFQSKERIGKVPKQNLIRLAPSTSRLAHNSRKFSSASCLTFWGSALRIGCIISCSLFEKPSPYQKLFMVYLQMFKSRIASENCACYMTLPAVWIKIQKVNKVIFSNRNKINVLKNSILHRRCSKESKKKN